MLEFAFEALAAVVVRPVERCDAKLKGVAGFTGAGDARFTAWPDGHVTLHVTLRGVAGLKADLWLRGEPFAPITGDKGQFTAKYDSALGDPAAVLAPGDFIEVRQNGNVILAGVLEGAIARAAPNRPSPKANA